jgi:hypothetical protein
MQKPGGRGRNAAGDKPMSRALLRLWRLGLGPLLVVPPAPPRRPAARRRKRAAKPRDFQRARVYRWEAEHVFPRAGERLSLERCRALVEAAYRWREEPGAGPGWAPPVVTDGRGRRHACGSRAAIKLPRWARTRAVVLHECAHGMADDQHGPGFVAVYVELLARFAGLDAARLRATLAAASVRVAPEGVGTGTPPAVNPALGRRV